MTISLFSDEILFDEITKKIKGPYTNRNYIKGTMITYYVSEKYICQIFLSSHLKLAYPESKNNNICFISEP